MVQRPIARPGDHGGDAAAIARALGIERGDLIDLSMSMNPFAPDVEAILSGRLESIRDYPDPASATAAVAATIGVDPARLVLTNGGSEAIALVAGVQPAGRVDEPEFSLYRRHLAKDLTGVDPTAPRWRSNPSNPLGQLAEPEPEPDDPASGAGMDVWDEAFYPLATGRWTDRRLDARPVWRLGSLTKLWSCPGLRIGYVIAPDDRAADAIRSRQPQWSLNGLALAAIRPLLDATDLDAWAEAMAAARAEFAGALRELGFAVTATDANWVLIGDRPGLRSEAVHHRVVVRDCSSFGLPDVSRVAIPRPHEFERVLRAFAAIAAPRA